MFHQIVSWELVSTATRAFCEEKKKLLDYFGSRKACRIKRNMVLIPLTEDCHVAYMVYFVFRLISEPPTLIPSQHVCYINIRQASLKFILLAAFLCKSWLIYTVFSPQRLRGREKKTYYISLKSIAWYDLNYFLVPSKPDQHNTLFRILSTC